MSIYVSFVSALSIVAAPGEVYKYGNALMWNVIVIPVVVLISCYTILPVFYRNDWKRSTNFFFGQFCRINISSLGKDQK